MTPSVSSLHYFSVLLNYRETSKLCVVHWLGYQPLISCLDCAQKGAQRHSPRTLINAHSPWLPARFTRFPGLPRSRVLVSRLSILRLKLKPAAHALQGLMKSTEVLNPRRTLQWLFLHTIAIAITQDKNTPLYYSYSYNTRQKYCRNGVLWSILYIATPSDIASKFALALSVLRQQNFRILRSFFCTTLTPAVCRYTCHALMSAGFFRIS